MGNRKDNPEILKTQLKFWKVEAAGNDFVMIDNRNAIFNTKDSQLIKKICHRRFGIGADGLIEVRVHKDYAFEMRYFNSDGTGPVMCGNGARAAVLFARNRGYFQKNQIRFLAPDGEHWADLEGLDISLTIKKPQKFKVLTEHESAFFIDTGTNHVVIPVKNIATLPIAEVAPYYRKKYDTNVNYIEKNSENAWQIRTWERGVEDETYACGTGATAAAFYLHEKKNIDYPITLTAKGGELTIFTKDEKLWLQGPAKVVFEGRLNI